MISQNFIEKKKKFNFKRPLRAFIFGFSVSPLNIYLWNFKILPFLINLSTKKILLTKISVFKKTTKKIFFFKNPFSKNKEFSHKIFKYLNKKIFLSIFFTNFIYSPYSIAITLFFLNFLEVI